MKTPEITPTIEGGSLTRLVRLVVPLLLLVIIIAIIWFSCITLFDGGNDGPGGAAIRSETSLPSPFQPNAQVQARSEAELPATPCSLSDQQPTES